MKRNPIFMRVNLLPSMVQIHLLFLILILLVLLALLIPFFLRVNQREYGVCFWLVFGGSPGGFCCQIFCNSKGLWRRWFSLSCSSGWDAIWGACPVWQSQGLAWQHLCTSPLFWSHCQEGIAFLKLLLKAGRARSYFASCALSFSLHYSSPSNLSL